MKMHMRCYEEREDVGAVVHAHPPTATGYAVANKPLDEYSMIETVIMIGSIPVTPYGTPSTYEVPEAGLQALHFLPLNLIMVLQGQRHPPQLTEGCQSCKLVQGSMEAHAWLRCGNRYISGETEMDRFTVTGLYGE